MKNSSMLNKRCVEFNLQINICLNINKKIALFLLAIFKNQFHILQNILSKYS